LKKSARDKRGSVTTIGDSILVSGMTFKELPKIIKLQKEQAIIVIHNGILKAVGATL
jgi:deoxyxylulose-5-phosphate synthase